MKMTIGNKWIGRRLFASFVLLAFLLDSGIAPVRYAYGQALFPLSQPGMRASLSPAFAPPLLKGLKVDPDNPFRVDFILDKGDSSGSAEQLKVESTRLIKYFLASITVPEKDLWVNLSPYEKDRIVPDAFGVTEMGRDLLAQDYMLKQITASVIYPEEAIGQKFWSKVYAEAQKRFGTTDVPVDTFNKVWIVPEKAVIYENKDSAYVVESRLQVLLEEDYLALEKGTVDRETGSETREANKLGAEVVREVVIPILEKEVNEGRNFAQLRQVYHSLILAIWYKDKIKESLLGKAYVDQNKVAGVDIEDKSAKEKIWTQYVEAFKKGAYNYIKEDLDPVTQQTVPKKYFSGGAGLYPTRTILSRSADEARLPRGVPERAMMIDANFSPRDRAVSLGEDAISGVEGIDKDELVVDIASPNGSRVELVGSKAANLRELSTIPGIVIPKGFSVTTRVFGQYLESLGVGDLIDAIEQASEAWKQTEENSSNRKKIDADLTSLSQKLQARIESGDVAPEFEEKIVAVYKALSASGEDILVATRSSATAEDMATASFAGQYTSVLNVRGPQQLMDAVKKVWASTYNINAINYRNKQGISHKSTSMAVLILEMVQAETAGTAFSVDVRTGMPMLMINNTYGLGEAEVAGKVSSDTWVVDPQTMSVLSRQLGSKAVRMIYDSEKGENAYVENIPDSRERFAIGSATALVIAEKLRRIHDYFSKKEGVRFVDIEYAVRSNGEIVLLQARPATLGKTKLAIVNQKLLKAHEKKSGQKYPVVLQGGVTGALGVVTGVVRVVDSLAEAQEKVRPGDILVAENTMSYWEKVMSIAGGMITAIGGPGNHTAVVAREEGKPAIVGNRQAMDILRNYDGKVITIDALMKKVYLGEIPKECILTPTSPDEIPTEYGGLDNVSYADGWAGATSVKQTIQDPDGKQWIGKPNERTSAFLQGIHRKSHEWMAKTAGLRVPVDRVLNGVYQASYPDIYDWNVSLRGWTLDQLEEMYGIWVRAINDYFYYTENLELNKSSVENWIESFIHINGIMNLAFPLNQVMAGQRDFAFFQKGIKEPYLSLLRSASGQFTEMLTNAELREYSALFDVVKQEAASHGILPAILQNFMEGDTTLALERLRARYPEFYRQMENYINNFRVTDEFALSMTAPLPWGRIARNLLKDLRNGRKISVSEPAFEEYYPEDKEFGRVVRLSALSEKLKQDSHHLKFRAQRRFMEIVRPFGDFLVRKGEIWNIDEMFEREPAWVIAMFEKYDRDPDFRSLKPAKSFDFKPYRLYTEHTLMVGRDVASLHLRGAIEDVQRQAEGWGLPRKYLENLGSAYDEAVQVFSKRHPERRDQWVGKHWDLRASDLRNKAYLVNHFLRESAMQTQALGDVKVEAVFTDVDETLLFLGLPRDQKADYLAAALFRNEKPDTVPMTLGGHYSLIDLFDSLGGLQEVLQLMVRRGDILAKDLERLEKAYRQRNFVAQLKEGLGVLAQGEDGQRHQDLASLLESNLKYLFGLWRDRNPDRPAEGFYMDLWEETKKTGVAPVVIILGGVNLRPEKGSVTDKVLFEKRAKIPSLETTPVRYTYIGGGGYNATTIGRSVRHVMKEKGIGSIGYDSVSISSPFDTGGSSQKDADAVRSKYGIQIMSPGDMMSVMSFLTASDAHWFSQEDSEGLKRTKHNPWDGEAIMDLLFTYSERVTVPEGTTLEEVIDKRIQRVNGDTSLVKPDNWQEFVINLKSAARFIDKELIDKGYLQGIRKDPTSVQNLLLMALFIAYDMNFSIALKEANRMLGLRKTLAIPTSFGEAVMVMRLKMPDGSTSKEIVGHLKIAEDSEEYKGLPYQLLYKKKAGIGRENEYLATPMGPDEYPKANPDAVHVIKNTKRAVIMGMGSAFDSMLCNLLLKDVIDALKAKMKEGVPVIYFPKILHELQTEGLSLKEVMELMERSIQRAIGDDSFRIQDIISHVVMPDVPQDFAVEYGEQLRRYAEYLNEQGKQRLSGAKTIKDIRDIIDDETTWNDATRKEKAVGKLKKGKFVPGDLFTFTEADWDFVKSRGIKLVGPTKEEGQKLYRIWQHKLIYSTNQVVRVVDRIADSERPELAMSAHGSTMLDIKTLNNIVEASGKALREFMAELIPYADDPKNSPYADLVRFDNLWQEVKHFRSNPEDFTDAKLLARKGQIPRIDIRGQEQPGGFATQVVVVGIPGKYRKKAALELDSIESDLGLVIENGGTMSIEIKRSWVNKALPIGYIGRHFNEILDRMGYTPGELINARKTRTVIFSDGDGTLYGKPRKDRDPTLSESPAVDDLVEYLRAGGIYILNTGNDSRLTVARLLANNAIPPELRHRILICADGGADIVGVNKDGGLIGFPDYKENAIREFFGSFNQDDTRGMDFVYIGDDADEQGNDFVAFKKAGMGRSITVAKEEIGEVPAGLRENYVGGLEFGTKTFLKNVVRQAKANQYRPLFSEQGIQDIVSHSRNGLGALDQDQLKNIVNEFIAQANERQSGGVRTTLAMEPAYLKNSAGQEQGDYIAVDWGGSNLRVMIVRLTPGQKPEVVKSMSMKFTDEHKTGRRDPFETIAEQIATLGISSVREYSLGFTFSQPVQQTGVASGKLRKWVKGWSIPGVEGKDVGVLLQRALEQEKLGNVKVKALLNDVVATHLAVPNADLGLILGTGFTYSLLDKDGQILNTEAGGFMFGDLPQTIFDRNLFQNVDPINEHAVEKMVSGAYLGKLLRMHLKFLRDRGVFMKGRDVVPFIDTPQRLSAEEFDNEDGLKHLIAAVQSDAKQRLKYPVPDGLSPREAAGWINKSPVLFKLFDSYGLDKFLTDSGRELYEKIRRQYDVNSLSDLSGGQVIRLVESSDGQRLQRIILDLIYADLVPGSPDVYMMKLISYVEQFDGASSLKQALSGGDRFRLSEMSDEDLKILWEQSHIISLRAGRLLAAVLFAGIKTMDAQLSKDHLVAVDGSVWENHPKMRGYVEDAIKELRSMEPTDGTGKIEFQFIKDASGVGAAIAAANASSASEGAMNMQEAPGGIDLTRDKMGLQVRTSGSGVQFTLDPVMVQQLQNASGLTPVIIDIHPMTTSVPIFLGIKEAVPEAKLSMR